MKLRQNKLLLYTLLSLFCAFGVFYLSLRFQEMAYWGDGLKWYWAGVSFTYLIGLIGVMFLILSMIKRDSAKRGFFSYIINFLRTVSFLALTIGFLWTTFVIIAGMSGM